MRNILLIGQAACGKGTQSKLLQERLGLYPIGMGDILREHKRQGTDIGKMATELDKEGKLMPNDIIIKLMKDEIINNKDNVNGFIFDGAVRTVEQAITLKRLMNDLNLPLEVVFFEISESTAMERALERGKTSGRVEDSNTDVIRNRFSIFNETTLPALEIFDSYWTVDAEKDIEEIYDEIDDLLKPSIATSKSWFFRNMDSVMAYSALIIGALSKVFLDDDVKTPYIAIYILSHIMVIGVYINTVIMNGGINKSQTLLILLFNILLPNFVFYITGNMAYATYYMILFTIVLNQMSFKKLYMDKNN